MLVILTWGCNASDVDCFLFYVHVAPVMCIGDPQLYQDQNLKWNYLELVPALAESHSNVWWENAIEDADYASLRALRIREIKMK